MNMGSILSKARVRTSIITTFVFVLILSTTGIASAGVAWGDPQICDTNLHLVYNPDGADVEIKCEKHDNWKVQVVYREKQCEPGTSYTIGIVEASSDAEAIEKAGNGEWFNELFATATCDDKGHINFKFEVKYRAKKDEYKLKVKD